MKRSVKFLITVFLFTVALVSLCISVGAENYEPDGSTSVVYDCDASDSNRTMIVKCVDESGNLIKQVTYKCKKGEDKIVGFGLYGYDIVAFESNQGLWETCKLTWCSGADGGQRGYVQIRYYFRTGLSKDTLKATVTVRKSGNIEVVTRHYVEYIDKSNPNYRYYTLHSKSSQTVEYLGYVSTSSKSITGYELKEGYQSSISGNLSYTWINKYPNIPNKPTSFACNLIQTSTSNDMDEWSTFDEDKQGKLDYCTNRTMYISYYYDMKEYTVSYNANGGSGAPSSQVKLYDRDLILSDVVPVRSGYNFVGWGVSVTDTSVNYAPGASYSSNTSRTLYAIWESNAPKTYTVSYNANGGTGAPASQTKTHNVNLTLRSTVPTRSGYSFMGWSTVSGTGQQIKYAAGGTYSENQSITLYAVWMEDRITYTVAYDANGGTNPPDPQIKIHDITLALTKNAPTREGYTFMGWSFVTVATVPDFFAGADFILNSSVRLYAVWYQNTPDSYVVTYDANGGTDEPASQIKTHDVELVLTSDIPIRKGYNFLGWSTNESDTDIEYASGDVYINNESVTLFAIWSKANYDFSVSELSVSNNEPYKYDKITVKVRSDSWDKVNAYSDIPIQLYYDGKLISTQYVDFTAYGIVNITFNLSVGSSLGSKSIEVRVNWADHGVETRTENNSVSTSINVRDDVYDVAVEPVLATDEYFEGMEVVSSFYVENNGDYDITPEMHNNARFSSYYYDGSQKVILSNGNWNDVVVPIGGTNLVYFKWKVPTGLSGRVIYLECTVNADKYIDESNYDNNTTCFTKTVRSASSSQTPDTRFETEAPSSYQNTNVPSISTDKSTWTMWAYENGSFVLKKYGVQISEASPIVIPDVDCLTAVCENGRWIMRSGYGITMNYMPSISSVSGYETPEGNAYTSVQYAVATFPEFRYYDTDGNCRTLQYVNGSYQFVQNSDADGNARVHFIPVYVTDGNYTVSVTATHVWTPTGMIEATRSANVIIIDGTVFDDWYQG